MNNQKMKMNTLMACLVASLLLDGCQPAQQNQQEKQEDQAKPVLSGTWQLVSAKVIAKGDTAITFPVEGQKMIKIFNGSHFSFFRHDLDKGKGKSSVFVAGGGTYTLAGEDYQEHLEYFSGRDWEGNDFHFKIALRNDSLIQTGMEKIDSLGINQEIVEIYVRE